MEINLTFRIGRLTEDGVPKLRVECRRTGFGTDNMEALADRLEAAVGEEMARIAQEQEGPLELRRGGESTPD